MYILFTAHSGIRWLLAAAVLLLLARLYALRRSGSEFGKTDNSLLIAMSVLFDAQLLLGLVMLGWDAIEKGFLPGYRIEHTLTMLLATFLAHLPGRWKGRPADVRVRDTFLVIAAVALLIVIGVTRLPQGW